MDRVVLREQWRLLVKDLTSEGDRVSNFNSQYNFSSYFCSGV